MKARATIFRLHVVVSKWAKSHKRFLFSYISTLSIFCAGEIREPVECGKSLTSQTLMTFVMCPSDIWLKGGCSRIATNMPTHFIRLLVRELGIEMKS